MKLNEFLKKVLCLSVIVPFILGFAVPSIILSGSVFPVIVATAASNTFPAGLNHTINLDDQIQQGDLLVIISCVDGGDNLSVPNFTQLCRRSDNGGGNGEVSIKIATGSEQSQLLATTPTNESTAHRYFRIKNFQGTPECVTAETAGSSDPDPANITPSWGSAKMKVIAAFAGHEGSNATVTGYPSNMNKDPNDASNPVQTGDDTGGCTMGTASVDVEASSFNPNVFNVTWGVGNNPDSFTVAIQGR